MLKDFKTREPPPLLYRYVKAERARQFIADPHFRFSSPATFNDPFEFRPELTIRARGKEFVELLRHNKLPLRTTVEQAEIILAEKIHQDAANRFHALCFTEDPLHPLMWAHYAASHTGFVLGFDSDLLTPFRLLGLLGFVVGPVGYSATRSVIEYPSVAGDEADTINAIFTKGTDWAYEREWRMALVRKEQIPPTAQRLMNFDPTLLRVIIVGSSCSREDYRTVLEGMKAARFRHVKVFLVKPEPRGYRFRIEQKDGSTFSLDQFVEKFARDREAQRASGKTWYAEGMRRRAEKGLPVPGMPREAGT